MNLIKGTLISIGGNEDKGGEENEVHTFDFIDEGILARVLRETGKMDPSIVVVPTASSIPVEVGENYLEAFGKLGCTNVKILDIRKKEQSNEDSSLEMVKDCDCIMFSGGNQSKISEKIRGTKLHDLLLDRYINEDFVIAGTSAGAMCMSHEMITGGSGTEVFFKGVVNMGSGLSFVPKLIIDSHFIRRGRFGRLAESVAKFPELLGIGLAEDTGIVIKGGRYLEIIGSGMVIVFDGSHLEHNNEELLEEGTPMTITNLTTHVLANSDRFDMKTRNVSVLPIDAPFV
jgi:cyanophycinase